MALTSSSSLCLNYNALKSEIQEQIEAFQMMTKSNHDALSPEVLLENISKLVEKDRPLPCSRLTVKNEVVDESNVDSLNGSESDAIVHDNYDDDHDFQVPSTSSAIRNRRKPRIIRGKLGRPKGSKTIPKALLEDQKDKDKSKTFKCDICFKLMSSRAFLERHKNRHTNGNLKLKPTKERRHKCDYCDRTFYETTHLRQHERSAHTGERPYPCPYSNCAKSFIQLGHLQQHIRWHTGDKRYQCPHCEAKFIQKNLLDTHMARHKL